MHEMTGALQRLATVQPTENCVLQGGINRHLVIGGRAKGG